jgi:threonine/homoserine/homoserine lactone efflux protein
VGAALQQLALVADASGDQVSGMPSTAHWLAFAVVALGMALTPGPNMIYLLSRSLSQGRAAGFLSLIGTASAFVVYMLSAALGLTALMMAAPLAYEVLKFAGAAYLAYLAWQSIKPGGRAPFEARELPKDTPRKLMAMGFLTNLLNPKAAVLYLTLLPQFVDDSRPDVLAQSVILGFTQIAASLSVNGAVIAAAGTISAFMARRPGWAVAQRWLMGTVLGGLAVRMATEARR